MDILYGSPLRGARLERVKALLARSELDYDDGVEFTVLLEENGESLATASRQNNVLKCIAVSPSRQGEGLSATLLTELFKEAFGKGMTHLFLYTRPDKRAMFADLGFYTVLETPRVLFMENVRDGVQKFVAALGDNGAAAGNDAGAIVANCNPFTNGHLYLVQQAAARCKTLHLFILSEDRSAFPAADRLRLAREATSDIANVRVHPTGDYLISAATFPTYFIKDKAAASSMNHELDLGIFAQCFAKPLGISTRFVGDEPFCLVTAGYNRAMLDFLPRHGVSVVVIPRLASDGAAVSASRVRQLLRENNRDAIRRLVPPSTYEYLFAQQ